MKRLLTTLCVLGLLACVGCGGGSGASSSPEHQQYIADAQTKIDNLKKQVDELKERAKPLTGDPRYEINGRIDNTNDRIMEAVSLLEELKTGPAKNWDKAKSDFEKTMEAGQAALSPAAPRTAPRPPRPRQ